jgi:septal ring factor EnvC (AmiA/AmiB activator)
MRRALSALVLLVTFAATGAAVAQSIGDERQALIDAKRQAQAATARSERFEADSARATEAAGKARAQAAAVAARIQAAEADIAAAEARIRIIEALRVVQRARLAAKQGPIVRLIAALQTMARRPPALALVQPGSMNDIAHVRALLGTTLPVIEERTKGLRAEVERGRQLRAQADEAVVLLKQGQDRLRDERARLTRLEAEQRQRSQSFTDSAMIESDRAIALGEKARDIVDLMRVLNDQASVRDRLITLPGPMLRPAVPGQAPPPPDRVPMPSLPPNYRLPVLGRIVTGLGEVSESGVRARGLTIQTRPDAQVIAPAGGRIVFAGRFRSYGSIVIIDHGRGWTTLVTSLSGITVAVGDAVDQGSPIGRAGAGRPTVTIELRHGADPVDITPLLGNA